MPSRSRPSPRLVLAAAVAALVLATAGCGAEDEPKALVPGGSTSTTAAATTTSPPSTTGGAAVTTTTAAPVDLGDAPAFHASGPSGSGCSPGAGTLPDGWWYGVSVVADPDQGDEGSFTFDLACYFVGDAAYAEGERLGVEVNNDYLVTNENPTLRTVPLAEGATAACVDLEAGVLQVACDPADVPDAETPWAVWFRVVDGEIDRLVEQYAP